LPARGIALSSAPASVLRRML